MKVRLGKIGKSIGWAFVVLFCLLMTLYLVIQIPYVQTKLCKYAIGRLTGGMDAEFTVGDVSVRFFNRLHIEDFAIVSGDTLLATKEIDARFSLRGLIDKSKTFSSVYIRDGVFNLISETDSTTNLDRIFPSSEESGEVDLDMSLKSLKIENFRFNLIDPFTDSGNADGEINFSNLGVSGINAGFSDITYRNGELYAAIDNISLREKSGTRINSFKGSAVVNAEGAAIYSPEIVAEGSHFKGEFVKLGFSSAKDLKYFTERVNIHTKFSNSTIAMKTIGRFAPEYLNSPLEFMAAGEVYGTVNNLTVARLDATTKTGETFASVSNLKFIGLPDHRNTVVRGEIKRFSTNGSDLSSLIAGLTDGQRIDYLDQLPKMQVWNYTGTVSGTLGNITADGVLSNGSSSMQTNTSVNIARDGKTPLVNCRIDANDVNLYPFTGSNILGSFSGKGNIKVNLAPDNTTIVNIDSLSIRKLGVNGYNLTGIFAKGTYAYDTFDGKIICHDPALDLMFQGNIATELKDGSTFNFYANIPYADLKALNIDTRDSISEISTFISADMFSDSESNLFGYLKIDNTTFTNSRGRQNIGNLDATSLFEDGKYVINIVSDFVKARYEGTKMIDSFIYQFRHQILRRHFSNMLKPYNQKYAEEKYNQDYSLTVKTLNMQGFCAFIMPGLYIQDGSSLRIKISENDHYRLVANSGRIAFEDNWLKNVRLTISDRDSTISASLFSKEIVAAGLAVDSTRVFATMQDNNADISIRFNNDSTQTNITSLNALVSILRDSTITVNGRNEHLTRPIAVKFKESDITLRGNRWNIRPSEFIYSDSLVVIDGFRIENRNQLLSAGGTLSRTRDDSLGVALDNFDISIIDQFLEEPLGLGGYLSGDARMSLKRNDTKMFAYFKGDSICMNNTLLGEVATNAIWSREDKRYNIDFKTFKDGNTNLAVNGFYRPADNYIDFNTNLDALELNYFEPFLTDVATHTSGTASGNLRVYGPADNFTISSENCRLNNYKFTIDFLQVPLTIDGPFTMNNNGIQINNAILADSLKGSGRVNGGITYNKFDNIKVDVRISMNNLLSLNTQEIDNEDFYGTVFSSGNVNITGDLSKIRLDVNARTDGKSQLHIPLSGASSASSSNILKFVEEEKPIEIDPYDTLYFARGKQVSEPTEIEVNLNATATPDASVWLEIDKSTGDIMKARGNGRISIRVNPSRDLLKMSGNYIVEEGSYHFVLMGLASRDFTVKPGSSVTLNDNIGNIGLDIDAIYSTKASINRLIADSTLSSTRQVDASIKITGVLDNPQIKFGIDIPDLDPTIKPLVDNALNSEEKIQKQFASLIAFGSFTPELESGISSSSTALYANATSMIMGQVNNLLMQLGIPLDLGFSYQQGTEAVNDAFEVAVSTQLFNNRVIINGSMGNNPYAAYTGNDVRGNIDIQVKLDRKGKVRMTFFSHAMDYYSSYLDISQRTGMGVAYQHEFNSFKDIFRKRSAAQKEYDKMLSIKEREEKKAARKQKRDERKKSKQDKMKAKE